MKAQKQKYYHDSKTKALPELNDEATVRIRNRNKWDTREQVVKKVETLRTYIIQTQAGRHLRRNRRDLLQTREEFAEDVPEGVDSFN